MQLFTISYEHTDRHIRFESRSIMFSHRIMFLDKALGEPTEFTPLLLERADIREHPDFRGYYVFRPETEEMQGIFCVRWRVVLMSEGVWIKPFELRADAQMLLDDYKTPLVNNPLPRSIPTCVANPLQGKHCIRECIAILQSGDSIGTRTDDGHYTWTLFNENGEPKLEKVDEWSVRIRQQSSAIDSQAL